MHFSSNNFVFLLLTRCTPATHMPFFVACDLKFPVTGDAQGRMLNCMSNIDALLPRQATNSGPATPNGHTTECRHWSIVYENEVDALNCKWRLFESDGKPQALQGIHASQVGLVLVEHVWPREYLSDGSRQSWHQKLLKALICQWPLAFICMVGRRGGMDNMNRIAESLKLTTRQQFLLPVWSHYSPRCQDSVTDQLVSGGESSLALVIAPKTSRDIDLHLYLKELAEWKMIYVPNLVESVSLLGAKQDCQLGPHIIQLAAWSLESTEAIVRHVACSPDCETLPAEGLAYWF